MTILFVCDQYENYTTDYFLIVCDQYEDYITDCFNCL